ncbi:MAG: hypothetical protein MJ016_04975 [Victivallaceae bacterium]|nr:hypothetical protein [Victivallaceae bacterium]
MKLNDLFQTNANAFFEGTPPGKSRIRVNIMGNGKPAKMRHLRAPVRWPENRKHRVNTVFPYEVVQSGIPGKQPEKPRRFRDVANLDVGRRVGRGKFAAHRIRSADKKKIV